MIFQLKSQRGRSLVPPRRAYTPLLWLFPHNTARPHLSAISMKA